MQMKKRHIYFMCFFFSLIWNWMLHIYNFFRVLCVFELCFASLVPYLLLKQNLFGSVFSKLDWNVVLWQVFDFDTSGLENRNWLFLLCNISWFALRVDSSGRRVASLDVDGVIKVRQHHTLPTFWGHSGQSWDIYGVNFLFRAFSHRFGHYQTTWFKPKPPSCPSLLCCPWSGPPNLTDW